MNDEISPEPKSQDSASEVDESFVEPSPGAMIRDARARAKISLEDLASQLKLARHTLDALERDDFRQLLEPVYVRGYYRKCAKVLGLPEKELLEAYEGRVSPKQPSAPSKLRLASGTELGSGNRLPVPMAIAFALLAIFVCVFIWNILKSPPPAIPATMPVPVEAPSAIATPALKLEEAVTADGPQAVPSTAPVANDALNAEPAANSAAVIPAQAGATNTANKPAAAAPVGAAAVTTKPDAPSPPTVTTVGSVTLNFVITSWARVDDGAGKNLLNGLMHAGDKQTLSGKPPFTVFLGNAPGVHVEYQGKEIDISKSIADNLTARFTVPQASKP